ncbi:hypothetical protein [Streptomyces sp. 8N616]|uniref:hypothetical protein n=1 Tax=Streptomyces sp. 8N616 TaxID=3457414 RepID=UPI003FD209DD
MRNTDIPAPEDYGFGKPIATTEDGDVLVYGPRKVDGRLRVPVTVTNHGGERAFYRVTIRVTGPGGYSATVHVDTHTTGVYPGTTWPTELTPGDPEHPVPGDPEVEITSSSRLER